MIVQKVQPIFCLIAYRYPSNTSFNSILTVLESGVSDIAYTFACIPCVLGF